MDDLLYHCHSGIFVLPSVVLVLEDGRFLLGCDACGLGRVWQEDDCPREYALMHFHIKLTNLFFQDEGKFDQRSIPLKSWHDYVCDLFVLI